VVIWYFSRFGILYQEKSGNPDFERACRGSDFSDRMIEKSRNRNTEAEIARWGPGVKSLECKRFLQFSPSASKSFLNHGRDSGDKSRFGDKNSFEYLKV
jgi:hypothetical protein